MQSPDINSNDLIEKSQPLVAGLYARVSTGRQENEATIESQLDEIKTQIVNDGNVLPVENIFTDDGWNGEMLQRPGLDAMRDAAMAGAFQILYVYDRGRLSRVFAYQEVVIEEIVEKGIQFVTLHDVKAETPEEKVLQAMQGVFHEYERVKIVERMRRGKLFKARSGILINGSALYGYNYVKKTDSEPAHYEINDEETRVVRMVFDWIGKEGIFLRQVMRRLYDLGIPPRKRKSDFWTKGPIVRMLRCETYITGIAYYNKSEAVVAKKPIKNVKYRRVKRNSRKVRPREEWIPFKVPVILEDKLLFEKVQKILDLNQKYACKKRKYNYLLTGLVYCECGNRRVGDGMDRENFYYRCTERINKFPKEGKCKSPGINAVVLDQVFWKKLLKLITNPLSIKKHAEEWLRMQINSDFNQRERVKLGGFMKKIEEEESRYARAYGVGSLEFGQFQELMKDTKKRKDAYQKQLDELETKAVYESINGITIGEIVEEAKKVLKSLDINNKFQLIRDIIDKVIVKGGQEVEVWGHIALPALNMGYEPIGRDSRSSQRREKYAIQCASKKASSRQCQLSLHND